MASVVGFGLPTFGLLIAGFRFALPQVPGAVGLAALAIAVEGYLRAPLAAIPRLCLVAAGVLLLFTAPLLAAIAAALIAAVLFVQRSNLKAT